MKRARKPRLQGPVFAVFLILIQCTHSASDREGLPPSPGDRLVQVPSPTDHFVENAGQIRNGEVLFYHRAGGMEIGFGISAILLKVLKPAPPPPLRSTGASALVAVPPSRFHTEARPFERAPGKPPGPLQDPTGDRVSLHQYGSEGALIRITFRGANRVAPQAREEIPFRSHYFLGNDPAGWRSDVRSYGELHYPDIYEGIDLRIREDPRGLKYEFQLRPGADLGAITLRLDGIEGLELAPDGAMVLRTSAGDLRDSAPSARLGDGVGVPCRFVLRDSRSYGFHCDRADPSSPLIVDPLIYSTYLGGTRKEGALSPHSRIPLAVDASGHAYVAGSTFSPDFPVTPGAFDTSLFGSVDAFVAKLNPQGSALLYATYLGGRLEEGVRGIQVDPSGNLYLTGATQSSDFPVTPGAFDTTFKALADRLDAFLAKLSPTGVDLIYSTYIGGSGSDAGRRVAVDAYGAAYVGGFTLSTNFPVTPGAYQTSSTAMGEGFVSKITPDGGAMGYSTYLGGSGGDGVQGIAVDAVGNAHLAVATNSSDFPTTVGAFDTSFNGPPTTFAGVDVVAAKLNANGTDLLYSTYIGGSGLDLPLSMKIDATGNAYIVGRSQSSDFPVSPDAFQDVLLGSQDIFLTKVNTEGTALVYSTLLGGGEADDGLDLALDAGGDAYVAGLTLSADFPTSLGAHDSTYNGWGDTVITRINASGSGIVYSTFLGGSGFDQVDGIGLIPSFGVVVSGLTSSIDFPVSPGAFDTTFNDGPYGDPGDVFVARIEIPGGATCPLSQGYWKNHPRKWPIFRLDLGSESYDQSELIDLMRTSPRGDASLILAKQLIAAKLNVANGSDASPVSGEIAAADSLSSAQSGRLPHEIHASTPTGQEMVRLASKLDDYNNKLLTPGCTP